MLYVNKSFSGGIRAGKERTGSMANVGSVLAGKYEIVRLIGEGGMSRVYLAMDVKLNKQWAVKEIKPSDDPVTQKIVRDSLVTEMNMIKRLDHPALPRITDLVDEDGVLYVVMDYIEGESLQRILEAQGAQSQDDVIDWGKQLCDALDYLHTRTPPIVYRDMKPGNVMLKPDGTVMIIDFGIAREYREEREGASERAGDTTMLGTRGYAAPEQFGGHGQTDARTDVYCLGATLYHLVTGKSPAEEPYVMFPIRQIDPSLSPGLEKIVSKATQQNPEKRYSSCAEMLYELERYRTVDDVHRAKLRRRWRAFVGVCAASAASLAVGLFGLGMAEASKSEDYGMQVELAGKAADQAQAAEHYLNAVAVRPERTEAYRGLVELYKADGSFTTVEEAQLLEAVMPNLAAAQSDATAYAELSFDVGKLYWYYYDYAADAGDNRLTRIKSASRWMNDSAGEPSFDRRALAEVYAGIAEFNNSIVARINEGGDAGSYEPYFRNLEQLVAIAADETNDVVVLETSALAADALHAYARKFRADGVPQDQMDALLDAALGNARSVQPTTDKLDAQQADILGKADETRARIGNAFVDGRTTE